MRNIHLLNEFMKENNLSYDEPFWVKISDKTKKQYKIVKSTIATLPVVYFCSSSNKWCMASDDALTNIMFNTNNKIIKPVWKPQEGEIYWSVSYDDDIYKRKWEDSTYDIHSFLLGNCFHSEAEAQANEDKILKLFNSNKPLIDLGEVE